ncbi:MAG: hypothetical protein R2794_11070 [Chitinophagales bacterium]
MSIYKISVLSILMLAIGYSASAKENIGVTGKRSSTYAKLNAGCADATTQVDLDINNVRARLLGAGDFWWDLQNDAKYEIPKVDPTTGTIPVSSSFAGALWIGGIDAGGQLKIAAQTYRQSGNDFWPGPLNADGTIDESTCNAYDRHWKINRTTIDDFFETILSYGGVPGVSPTTAAIPEAEIPAIIREWPALGNVNATGKAGEILNVQKDLAPFVDVNFDGIYDPTVGDYPDIDGDQAIFWVYNDKGNIHTESGGDAIGLEIRALAFAFQTNDDINNMTFYRYKVTNYATSALDSTYFGQWVDSDLGFYNDDWVGCDTVLSLGMCYNGDAVDGPAAAAYGANPPIFGTDFFQGPIKYIMDEGAIVDSIRLGMSAFLYYNNDFSITGNPEVAAHYYGYLSGTWKDGSPFTYGGTGYGGTTLSNYIFPSDPSDPTGWSECTEGNVPADRRYLQSSGPFTLLPGAANEVVMGALWVRPPVSGGCQTAFDMAALADQKAQALFDADFQLIGGPDAPDMEVRELDQSLVLSLINGPTSNNIGESYEETDPLIVSIVTELPDSVIEANPGILDSTYNFQGYKIYQLENASVSPSEYSDVTKAKLIYQCDLKDGVDKIVNYSFDAVVASDVPELMVAGNDNGIRHTFEITDDAFATGNTKLVNFKTYYFSVVAYAYNNFLPYDPIDPNSQKRAYLEGRKNIKIYTAVPHKPDPENGGMVLNANYGDGPDITKIEGLGNGGNFQMLTEETIDQLLTDKVVDYPVYKGRNAPIDVMVYDPVRLPAADFQLKLVDSSNSDPMLPDSTWWVLTNLTEGTTVVSDFPINFVNEQIIPEWGLSVTVHAVADPGGQDVAGTFIEHEENNGFIGASLTYADNSRQWLTGVQDVDGTILDWIRSGSADGIFADVLPNPDENQVYEGVLGGTWAPTEVVAFSTAEVPFVPLRSIVGLRPQIPIEKTVGVDVVFTSDKSKWSRCVVLESGECTNTLSAGEIKLDMRQMSSRNIDGTIDGGSKGYSWFPGYAVDVESGRRLNIFFGEDGCPTQLDGRGRDMVWNPSSDFFDPAFTNAIYGGKHYIYVSKTTYDECKNIHDTLQWVGGVKPETSYYKDIFKNVVWITMPFLNQGYSSNVGETMEIPTETTVRLRVTKPYVQYYVDGTNIGKPVYAFSTKTLAATTGDAAVASSALDLIRVVPNPYYAYSAYETSPIDNRVKITNLPAKCSVSIFTLDGTLVRRFQRDVSIDNTSGGELNSKSGNLDTSIDWDLKNNKNVPLASGMYIIHIDAGELGEKTIKWFGVMRPIDLDTF